MTDDNGAWVTDENVALLTDLYELTMLQSYWRKGMDDDATFSLHVRRLPEGRNYLLACGPEDALHYLESVRFSDDDLEFPADRDEFGSGFVDWLAEFEFTGDVHGVPEGTPVFPDEPLLEATPAVAEQHLLEVAAG